MTKRLTALAIILAATGTTTAVLAASPPASTTPAPAPAATSGPLPIVKHWVTPTTAAPTFNGQPCVACIVGHAQLPPSQGAHDGVPLPTRTTVPAPAPVRTAAVAPKPAVRPAVVAAAKPATTPVTTTPKVVTNLVTGSNPLVWVRTPDGHISSTGLAEAQSAGLPILSRDADPTVTAVTPQYTATYNGQTYTFGGPTQMPLSTAISAGYPIIAGI